MAQTVFDARVKFAPTVNVRDGREYVSITCSKKTGTDKTTNKGIYDEFKLGVWNQRDIELARSLGVGDYIVFTIENPRQMLRTDKTTGKVYQYVMGNVVSGEIRATFTTKPSATLYQYQVAKELQWEQQRMAKNAQKEVNTNVQPSGTSVCPTPSTASFGENGVSNGAFGTATIGGGAGASNMPTAGMMSPQNVTIAPPQQVQQPQTMQVQTQAQVQQPQTMQMQTQAQVQQPQTMQMQTQVQQPQQPQTATIIQPPTMAADEDEDIEIPF